MALVAASRTEVFATVTFHIDSLLRLDTSKSRAAKARTPLELFRSLDESIFHIVEVLIVAEFVQILPEHSLRDKVATRGAEALGIHDFDSFTKLLKDILTKAIFADHVPTVAHGVDLIWLALAVAAWTVEVSH